jgi:hypothetical protein
MNSKTIHRTLRVSATEDAAIRLLEQRDRLTRSEVIRRAIIAAAQAAGLWPPPEATKK